MPSTPVVMHCRGYKSRDYGRADKDAASWFGAMYIQQHELHRGGEIAPLTGHEVALLVYFARHPHDVLSRERLLRDVWGNQGGMVTRAADLAIGRLRKKIEEDASARDIS